MDNRGWSDIAYNYLVCPHDYCYEGRGYDRRSSANGSLAANYASFAICALWGSASADDPLPSGLKDAFLYAINLLQTKGGSTTVIKGHRDWKSTDCPGNQIYAWIKAGCPDPTPTVVYEDAKVEAGMALSPEATRQVAQVVVACIEQECKDGQSLHELVQIYSAFGAKHSDQLVDDTGEYAGKVVDVVLKDDFASIGTRLTALEAKYSDVSGQLATIIDMLRDAANANS